MLRGLLAVLFGSLIFVNVSFADTTWVSSGFVSGIWTANHSPYMVTGNITVNSGQSLQIEPGVSLVSLQAFYGLRINGRIEARGTIADSIRFINWSSIQFYSSDDSSAFDYCDFNIADRIQFHDSHADIGHCRFSDNMIGSPAILISNANDSSLFRISNCVIENNAFPGIEVISGHALITRCLIRENWNNTSFGGAVRVTLNSVVQMDDCQILQNSAIRGGGIACIGRSRLIMNRCLVSRNSAREAVGGGILVTNGARLEMDDCTLSRNVADAGMFGVGGGAIAGGDGDEGATVVGYIRLNYCLLDSNIAGNEGGAIAGGDSLILRNCTVTRNRANRGKAICRTNHLILENSIFAANLTPYMYDLVIADLRDTSDIRYCDFWENSTRNLSDIPGLRGLGVRSQVNANGDSCDTYHNLFLDAQFVDTIQGDYQLLATSPCIDAGNPASPRDFDGSVADMGAFIYAHPISASPEAAALPQSLALSVYPNPFNNATRIAYDLAREGPVTLTLFDITGRRVQTLFSETQTAGHHEVFFDGAGLSSGVYLYRLQSEATSATMKAILLK